MSSTATRRFFCCDTVSAIKHGPVASNLVGAAASLLLLLGRDQRLQLIHGSLDSFDFSNHVWCRLCDAGPQRWLDQALLEDGRRRNGHQFMVSELTAKTELLRLLPGKKEDKNELYRLIFEEYEGNSTFSCAATRRMSLSLSGRAPGPLSCSSDTDAASTAEG